jgi:hypothetical protein
VVEQSNQYVIQFQNIHQHSIHAGIRLGAALATGHSMITVGEGNRHFRVSGDFLFAIEGITVVRYSGSVSDITLNREITIIGEGCFIYCRSISSFRVEFSYCAIHIERVENHSGSPLTCIERRAFSYCAMSQSICIPSSVEVICKESLSCCSLLSSVTFESGLRLKRIESGSFKYCSALRVICIPPSVKSLPLGCFNERPLTSWQIVKFQ